MVETLSRSIPAELETSVRTVLEAACEQDLKIVTAESCTGGLVAALLTDVEGCSHAFERGFVVYTDTAKHEMLGVPLDLLEDAGAVSERVARVMAEGALANSQGDLALSVTGFAGEGAPGDTPGLVHFALARRGRGTIHREERFAKGDRGGVRVQSLQVALEILADALDRGSASGGDAEGGHEGD